MRLLNGTMSVIQETDEEIEETFYNNSIASVRECTNNCNCTQTASSHHKRKTSTVSNRSKHKIDHVTVRFEQPRQINYALMGLPKPRQRGEKSKEIKVK